MTVFLQLENYTPSEAADIDLGLIVRGREGQYPILSDGKKYEEDLHRNIPCWNKSKCGIHFRFGDGDSTDDEMAFATKVTF